MKITRPWAFWRRVQYGGGLAAICLLIAGGIYANYIYQPPSCFDGEQNGNERGVDCGGACAKVCAFDVTEPSIQWAQSFRVRDGMYNAVAYVENTNIHVGTPAFEYTFTLYNSDGNLITERSGTTFLPPNSVYPVFESRIAVGNQTPTRTFLEIEPIDNWQDMSISRDQFIVRERTLSGVDTRPRLDARIYNTLLEEHTDVEIVATIFDRSGNALTASQTVVPLLEAREERSVVFTWPEPIAATLRSCEIPTDVMLAIDLSGSMNDAGGNPPEPLTSTKRAASGFVERLKQRDQVGVVTFATNADLVQNLRGDHTRVSAFIEELVIDPREETGATNIGDAIVFAREELVSPRHNNNARKILVLLTDGLANAPGDEPEVYARAEAAAAKGEDVTLFTIGLGNSVNEAFLTDLASSDAHALFAADPATLDQVYRDISSAICEDGPAVIDIIPKTRGDQISGS